jgi:hypothetical protein
VAVVVSAFVAVPASAEAAASSVRTVSLAAASLMFARFLLHFCEASRAVLQELAHQLQALVAPTFVEGRVGWIALHVAQLVDAETLEETPHEVTPARIAHQPEQFVDFVAFVERLGLRLRFSFRQYVWSHC